MIHGQLMKTRRGHSNLFLGFKGWVKLLKTYQMAQMDLKRGEKRGTV